MVGHETVRERWTRRDGMEIKGPPSRVLCIPVNLLARQTAVTRSRTLIWKNLRDYARIFDANRVLTGTIRLARLAFG